MSAGREVGSGRGEKLSADVGCFTYDIGVDAPEELEPTIAVLPRITVRELPAGKTSYVAGCVADQRPLTGQWLGPVDRRLNRCPPGSADAREVGEGDGELCRAGELFPDHWSFMLGEIALYSFIILILTGIFLTFFYTPSLEEVVY
ncbi:MAG: hypothetical protein ACRDQA_14835, partial [Nocardioidaceae bacterium]